jgi:hypothetical protein
MAIDNPYGYTDNASNNDNDDDYEVIDLSKQEPLFDKDCKHYFVLDGDELGGQVGWICQKCHRGTFLPKGMTVINS